MIYVSLPNHGGRRLSFYLAMEEFVARETNIDEAFFMWQVPPSVIFGRNQLIENEVNIAFCRAHGIQMFRRKSGGGCVYADMTNVMFSYITAQEQVGFVFNRYVNMVALVLRELGIDAHATGRNDIMIGGKKVSGNAFYHLPGRSIVHGTMLYDTNMSNMVGSITPSEEKLISKGVESVRQHVALLKDYTSMSLSAFMAFVKQRLCTDEVKLTDVQVRRIEEMEREYLTPEFIFGNNPRYTLIKRRRIEGVGDLELRMEVKNGVIKNADVKGDYFLTGDIDTVMNALKGVSLNSESLQRALPDNMSDVIVGLTKQEMIDLIIETNNIDEHGK